MVEVAATVGVVGAQRQAKLLDATTPVIMMEEPAAVMAWEHWPHQRGLKVVVRGTEQGGEVVQPAEMLVLECNRIGLDLSCDSEVRARLGAVWDPGLGREVARRDEVFRRSLRL